MGSKYAVGHETECHCKRAAMKGLVILAGLGLAIAVSPAHADTNPPVSHQRPEAYVPGLGEIMSLQLMRHAKLWLAGSRGNWALADYELDELREGFEDASNLHPTHERAPVAALIANRPSGAAFSNQTFGPGPN